MGPEIYSLVVDCLPSMYEALGSVIEGGRDALKALPHAFPISGAKISLKWIHGLS